MDYGIVATENGVGIDNSADYQHVIDSRWLGLDVILEDDYELPPYDANNNLRIVTEHNLGFTPFYLVFGKYVTPSTDARKKMDNTWVLLTDIYADSKTLFTTGGAFYNPTDSNNRVTTMHCVIFSLPLDRNYTSPVLNPSDEAALADSDYGVQSVIDGRNVRSSNKSDFTIDTTMRAYGVSNVLYTTGTYAGTSAGVPVYDYVCTHNLGYTPLAFAGKWGNSTTFGPGNGPYINLTYNLDEVNGTNAAVRGSFANASDKFSIVVLKSPLQPQNIPTTKVTYG